VRYDRFIELREGRWQAFRQQLQQLDGRSPMQHLELEALAVEYRRVLQDHALAQSRFPGTWVAKHLHDLVLEANHRLRISPGWQRFRLGRFYRQRLPQLFRLHLVELGVAVSVFLVSAVLGLSMTVVQPSVGESFIGQGAVEGLRQGRLWTEVIADEGQHAFAAGMIARNNMAVALIAWGGGILAGTLTLWVVLVNGFMLGSVIGVTMHYQMEGRLFEFISAHGPLELTLILVAAAGGLKIARAVVTAGVTPRGERINIAARQSMALVLGCLPFFLLLGLVEGFVSPAPGLGSGFKVAVGVALWAVFVVVVARPGLGRAAPVRPSRPIDPVAASS
jgi:uncharacterized membrane protein SpoIIM required for sporulation